MAEYNLYVLEDTRGDYRRCEIWNKDHIKNGKINEYFPEIELKMVWDAKRNHPDDYIEKALTNNKNIDGSVFLLDLALKGVHGMGEYAGRNVYNRLVDVAQVAQRTIIMSGNLDPFNDVCRAMVEKTEINQSGSDPTILKQKILEAPVQRWKRNELVPTGKKLASWEELVIREVYEFCQEDVLEKELKEGNVNGMWKKWTEYVKEFGIDKEELSIPDVVNIKRNNLYTKDLNGWVDFFEEQAQKIRDDAFDKNDIIGDFENFLPGFMRKVRLADGSWIKDDSD